jgi:hypothetical protein
MVSDGVVQSHMGHISNKSPATSVVPTKDQEALRPAGLGNTSARVSNPKALNPTSATQKWMGSGLHLISMKLQYVM